MARQQLPLWIQCRLRQQRLIQPSPTWRRTSSPALSECSSCSTERGDSFGLLQVVRIDLGVVEMSLLLLHASRSRMRLPKPCDRSCDDQSQIYTNEKAQCGDQSIHSPRDDHYQHAKPGILRARKYRKWLKRCGEQPRLSNSELQTRILVVTKT